MPYCPGCGAVNQEEALNCGACGRVLGTICGHCHSPNQMGARYCTGCGKLMGTATKDRLGAPEGEPIAEMMARKRPVVVAPGTTEVPPRAAFLKVVLGGFIFALFYLSQALSGYPILTILVGLGSGVVCLWGLVDLALWVMERGETHTAGGATEEEILEPLPETALSEAVVAEGSFADAERDLEPVTRVATPTATTPSPLPFTESSPVAPTTTSEVAPPAPSDVLSSREDDLTVSQEDMLEARERAKSSQTLAEFLEQGVVHEIRSTERKLDKSPKNVSLLMRVAQLYEERGEMSNALSAMEHCIKLDPREPEIYLYHGVLLRRAGRVDEARQALEKAIGLNRFLSKAFYQLGALERSQNRLQPARDAFQRCIQLAPDDAYAHYQLGMIYRDMNDLGLAQMELKRACLLNPHDSYGHSRLGQIYQLNKQWEQAVYEFSQALSLKPNDAFVLEKLAEVMVEKNELERARDLYQEALSHQFHPEPSTMVAQARVLYKLGRTAAMKPILDEILRLAPDQPDALYLYALVRSSEKDIDGAIDLLKKVTTLHPERWEVWFELGRLLQSLDRNEEALAAYIKASPNASDQAGIWNTIGVLLTNQKDFEGATKAFKKAVSFDYSDPQIQANLRAVQKKVESTCRRIIEKANELLAANPNELSAYIELGHAYELLDRPEDALMSYQRLLSIKSDSIEGLAAYARLLKSRGKMRMAMRCYREILKLQPNHFDARLQLVRTGLNLGHINEALRHAVVAQKLHPDDPQVHFLLGKIYFAKGLAPRALKEFTQVANTARDPDMVSWAEIMRRRLTKNL
ncbi:MAG TPA: tetratricopeptide repeat protein [Candidatus Ozemobacteraceae bacterium]|nr:tetratricopeptide repeat protein [Candidatus Ozemobacteraceae bacterium]